MYRVEQKYIVTEDTIAYLKKRLETCMAYDSHAGAEGYTIRSIYFDDMYDTCFRENESGTDPREKFRIRAYNGSKDLISLELKSKRKGYIRKENQKISLALCNSIMNRRFPSMAQLRSNSVFENDATIAEKKESLKDELSGAASEDGYLYKKLYGKYLGFRTQPVCIIEYERVAFVDRIGNVRITFDRNIGISEEIGDFFSDRLPCLPVLPRGMHILEVKYDELLPDLYRSILKECSLQRTDFSKYYYGRMALKEFYKGEWK